MAERQVVNYQTALQELVNRRFLKTVKYREQQARALRDGLYFDPDKGRYPIDTFERAFVREMKRRGIPLFAHSVVRTFEEQDKLFAKGVTKAKAGQSPHNYGMAVDIVHGVKAWDLDKRSWAIVGNVGHQVAQRLGIRMQWGGHWKFYDPAHWELQDWRQLVNDQGTS